MAEQTRISAPTSSTEKCTKVHSVAYLTVAVGRSRDVIRSNFLSGSVSDITVSGPSSGVRTPNTTLLSHKRSSKLNSPRDESRSGETSRDQKRKPGQKF
eukprot:1752698-Rhodomonas_salina.3